MNNKISGRDGPMDSTHLSSLVSRALSAETDIALLDEFVTADAPTLGNTNTLWFANNLDTFAFSGNSANTAEGWVARGRFPFLMFVLAADQSSAANGVAIQASLDAGVSYLASGPPATYLTANGLMIFTFLRASPVMRLRYTGGGATPTSFFGAMFACRRNPLP